VVVDTNVYISAFLHPERPIFQIVQQAAERRYRLLISPAIVNKVGRVLRETFGLEERVKIHRLKALVKATEILVVGQFRCNMGSMTSTSCFRSPSDGP
jgi:predicted nucleic acid-binding protein